MAGHQPAVLVTGGAGFLGANLVRELLVVREFADHEIVVLDDLSAGRRENLPEDPRVRVVVGSVGDDELVETLFVRHRFPYVYHLAAYAAEGLSHFIRRFNYSNNVLGSVTLINAAIRHDAACFVFASSIAVYGAGALPLHEDSVPQPEDPYGVAKYAVELDLRAAHRMFGLNSVVFRPHNIYGEYQNLGDRYRNVVGIFMNRLLQGRPLPVFGDGNQQRAFTYVRDIVPIIARSPLEREAWNNVFNIGADEPCTVNELAHTVAAEFGVPLEIEYLEARREVVEAYASHERCRRVFGGGARTSLREGVARMAAWARQAGVHATPEFTNIEIRRNLPATWQRPT